MRVDLLPDQDIHIAALQRFDRVVACHLNKFDLDAKFDADGAQNVGLVACYFAQFVVPRERVGVVVRADAQFVGLLDAGQRRGGGLRRDLSGVRLRHGRRRDQRRGRTGDRRGRCEASAVPSRRFSWRGGNLRRGRLGDLGSPLPLCRRTQFQ